MSIRELSADDFTATLRDNDIVLAYFWSAESDACLRFAPTYQESADKHPGVVHGRIDFDAEKALVEAASIPVIPALLAFKRGQLMFKQIGQITAVLDDLVAQLEAYQM